MQPSGKVAGGKDDPVKELSRGVLLDSICESLSGGTASQAAKAADPDKQALRAGEEDFLSGATLPWDSLSHATFVALGRERLLNLASQDSGETNAFESREQAPTEKLRATVFSLTVEDPAEMLRLPAWEGRQGLEPTLTGGSAPKEGPATKAPWAPSCLTEKAEGDKARPTPKSLSLGGLPRRAIVSAVAVG